MKVYIFLTSKIGGIGGAQLYLRNKIRFLQDSGWNAFILYTNETEIELEDLQKHKSKCHCPQLRFHPASYTRKKQRKLTSKCISKILSGFQNKEIETVLESHFINHALWGDLLAHYTNAKHLVYLLSDRSLGINKYDEKYFRFKIKNNSLAVIDEKIFPKIFPSLTNFLEINNFTLKAGILNNSMQPMEHEKIDSLKKKDLNIITIARLDKPFVNGLFDQIIKFSKYFSEKTIQYVIIGSSQNGAKEAEMVFKASSIPNLTFVNVPSTFPLPSQILNLADVFISSAGGASTCASEGGLTLSVDLISAKPIGFLGIDTNNTAIAENETTYTSVFNVLKDFFEIENHQIILKSKMDFKVDSQETIYGSHFDYIAKMDYSYFFNSTLKPRLKPFLSRIVKQLKAKKINH